MYDSNQSDNLSDIARWWVAGLLKHAPALTALCCPTVNCYRRLGSGVISKFANWGIDDRDAAIRVKNYNPKVCHNLIFIFTARCYASAGSLWATVVVFIYPSPTVMHYIERAGYFELAFVLSSTPLNVRTAATTPLYCLMRTVNCPLTILVVDPPSLF